MAFSSASIALLSILAVSSLALPQQFPLQEASSKTDLINELRKAEIIPTVLDEFEPKLTLSIFWENATAEVGNTINPSRVQEAPEVQFISTTTSLRTDDNDDAPQHQQQHGPARPRQAHAHPQLTLAMTDPDAPSRDNPEWSQICHWIVTGVPLTTTPGTTVPIDTPHTASYHAMTSLKDIMPYKPPGPPPKTGKHRYVFVALAPRNGTTEPLNLTKPGDRQHWGFGEERLGLREWADGQGLVVVGANFIYAQNDKQ